MNENVLSLSKDEFMRTKIIMSLKSLLLTCSYPKLTVTSICDHAGIARSSFYHLFSDIDDAIDWEMGRLFSAAADKHPFCTDWRSDLTKQLAEFMRYETDEAVVYQRIGKGMSLVDHSSIFWRTYRRRCQLFLQTIETWQGAPADARCEFEIDFFVCGESHTVAKWMIAMKEAPEAVAESIVACVPSYLADTLDAGIAAYQRRQEKTAEQ